MRKITRYVFFQCLASMVLISAGLIAAVWTTQSIRFIDFVINRGLPAEVFFQLTGLIAPKLMTLVLPIALFVAVLFTYNKLLGDSELVVLQAAGFSQWQLIRPALMLSVFTAIILYGLTLYLAPATLRSFKDLKSELRDNFARVMLEEGTFKEVFEGITVYVGKRGSDGELYELLVDDSRDPGHRETMMAAVGSIVNTSAGTRLVLLDGNRQSIEKDPESGALRQLSILYFDQYTVDLELGGGEESSRWRKADERFVHELWFPANNPDDQKNIDRFRAEAVHRVLIPLHGLAFTMVAMAALLGGQFSRRGQGMRILGAFLTVVLLEGLVLGSKNVASQVPSLLPAMALPVVVPIVGGAWMLRSNQRRPPTEAPGSGPDDVDEEPVGAPA
ncbi:MAG: LPS export ABC transporter permease LptF [Alphaproteobacteria bacterium]|nr:LPS export ABC transporter permease LptF [Alphaproteobacteria bacterium]